MFKINYALIPDKTGRIGLPFIELQSVDSTNNYAITAVHEGMAHHGAAVFAHYQTAGKGQRSKQWLAQQNLNIMMSVVVEPAPLSLPQLFTFSMAAALAVHGFFKKFAGDETKIKWPNDIYWRDRKAAGILIENILQGNQWKAAIVGIGININQVHFEDLQNKAVSLKQITGKTFDTVQLAQQLCTELDGVLKKLYANENDIINQYHQALYKLGERVQLKAGDRIFKTQIKGVSPQGRLLTQHVVAESFAVGEVEWLL